ncbi:MAG TPA: mechanosensitive ion channel family protein [Acidimicrobiales bacterium]|nr:mechanosensitive ion channel family protein [Acidimicrobiales bacterium]
MVALFAALVSAQADDPTDSELLEACGENGGAACRYVFTETDNTTLAQAVDFLLAKPLKIALIVVLALLATRIARRAIKRFVRSFEQPEVQRTLGTIREKTPSALLTTGPVNLRSAQRAGTIGAVMSSITTAVVWAIALFTILAEFGVNLGPLIAGAGIVGVALGFGAQSLVKDFLSGMFMLVEDQFGVGDIIDVGDASGTVEGVSLRTTRLRDVEGTVWHFPNGTIQRVANMSQQWSRALIDFEVAYETDLTKAKDIIKRVADDLWKDQSWEASILEEPEVWGVEAFGPDGVAIRLVVKTLPSAQFKVMRELRQRMKEAFDAEGIEIPFPQRTVWVRPDGATLAGTEEANGHTSSGQAKEKGGRQVESPGPTPGPG